MVELITKQSALDAIDKESEFIEREINDATKHPDEYTDNFISFSRERQCGLADAYIAVDELSPVETMTDDDLISREAAIDEALMFFIEYLGGAFDEDSQRLLAQRMNLLPSAEPVNKDAISREGLLKSWDELSIRGRTEFDQVIMTIPALPSAEKVHGEWVNEWKGIDGGRMYGACCSVCHALGHSGYNFCPNCGAKMDKGED